MFEMKKPAISSLERFMIKESPNSLIASCAILKIEWLKLFRLIKMNLNKYIHPIITRINKIVA